MTPEQIIEIAKSSGMFVMERKPYDEHFQGNMFHVSIFVETIEANTREACAKRIEQDLYPTEKTDYQGQYNAGVRYLAEQIRRME